MIQRLFLIFRFVIFFQKKLITISLKMYEWKIVRDVYFYIITESLLITFSRHKDNDRVSVLLSKIC